MFCLAQGHKVSRFALRLTAQTAHRALSDLLVFQVPYLPVSGNLGGRIRDHGQFMAIQECVKCGYIAWKMPDTYLNAKSNIEKNPSNWNNETLQSLEGSCRTTTIRGMRAIRHRTRTNGGAKRDGSNMYSIASKTRTELLLLTHPHTHVVIDFFRCTHLVT